MKNDSKLARFFEERGAKLSISSNPKLDLNQKQMFYLASGDPVNIFALHKDFQDQRHFIANAVKGEIIFFFPQNLEQFTQIVAFSEGKTELISLGESEISNLVKSDLFLQKELAYEVENWVAKLFEPFEADMGKRKSHFIESESEIEVQANEIVIKRKTEDLNLAWIEMLEGDLLPLGQGDRKLNSLFKPIPFTAKLWYRSESASKMKIINPIDFFQNYDFINSFDQFTSHYLNQLQLDLHRKQEQKKELVGLRNKEERLSLSYAIEKIKTLFAKKEEKAYRKQADPVCNALERLSSHLDLTFVYPSQIKKVESVSEKLQSICHLSGIQARRIKLTPNWWKRDSGPFLGFFKETKRPVVLIKRSTRCYTLLDDQITLKVSQSIADSLLTQAYMFYSPLREESKNGASLLKEIAIKYKRSLISIFGFGFLGSLLLLMIPLGTRLIFDLAIPKSDNSLLSYMIAGMLGATIGFALFNLIRSIFTMRFGAMASHFLETAIWDRVLKLKVNFFSRYTTGNLFSRLFCIERIRVYLSGDFAGYILNALFSFLFVFLMFFFSPLLASITLLLSIICLSLTLLFCKRKKRLLTEALEVDGNVTGLVTQLIINVNKLKAAGAEKTAFAQWSKGYTDYQNIYLKMKNTEAWVASLSVFFPIVSYLFVYIALIWWIKIINFPMADFLGFTVAFSSFLIAFYPANFILMKIVEVIPNWKRLNPILEEKLDSNILSRRESSNVGSLRGEIKFDNVTFSYDQNATIPIINNISFTVQPNEFFAIVGPSGDGKSTIIRLLLGFEKSNSGTICYDERTIDSYDLVKLRQQLGIVFQNEGTMAGSLYNNITSGESYTLEQIKEAVKISEFDKDLAGMPMGLNTVIPMNASTLSGGQKQRLLLTRALIRNPKIIIFDEATSALDNVTQNNVSENLAKLNVTRIVIAQRLSTIKKADKIIVLQKGQIVQQGDFNSLAKEPGLFQEMLKHQQL